MRFPISRFTFALVVSSLPLAGCGGSGSSASTTVTGSAVAGPVTGTVRVTNSAGKSLGTAAVTGGDFAVTLQDSALADELDFQVTGSYTDEATGSTVNLSAANPLALRLAPGALAAGAEAVVGVTPETTVIRQMVTEQTMTLEQARSAYQGALGNVPTGAGRPFAPNGSAPAWADAGARDAAFRVGAYSQWGGSLGLQGDQLAQLPTALAADLADSNLDGLDGAGNQVVIGAVNLRALHTASPLAARYLTAMTRFAGDATLNVAGLTAPADGLPPNARVTEVIAGATAAERIVTLADQSQIRVQVKLVNVAPFGMAPATARTRYRVTLTRVADGLPVDVTAPGAAVTAITAASTMHMLTGHHHSTPMTTAYEGSSTPANGFYDFSVYYVMASAMGMNGMAVPMGLWDLSLQLTDATVAPAATQVALFHPNVAMPMGATLSSKGNDSLDLVPNPKNPAATMARPYWVWLDSVAANAGGGHDIGLYLTTKDGMNFPAAFDGAIYADTAVTASNVTVRISADGGTTWSPALAEDGVGHYTITGFTGLTTGVTANLLVEVTVTMGGTAHGLKLAAGTDPLLQFAAP